MGPCMCGDTYCRSCGPAQGNSRCDVCGKWEADGGCDNPDSCNETARINDEAFAKQMAEWDKAEADYVQQMKEERGF